MGECDGTPLHDPSVVDVEIQEGWVDALRTAHPDLFEMMWAGSGGTPQ